MAIYSYHLKIKRAQSLGELGKEKPQDAPKYKNLPTEKPPKGSMMYKLAEFINAILAIPFLNCQLFSSLSCAEYLAV
jgi:hypothetical protein